jgi:hypothetical protein
MEIDNAFLSLGLTVVGLIAGFGYFSMNQKNFQTGYNDRIVALEAKLKDCDLAEMGADLRELRTMIAPFWKAIESQVPGMLLKGNPIEEGTKLFTLLSKFKAGRITDSEICEMIDELDREVKNNGHTPGEVVMMIMLSASQKARLPVKGVDCAEYVPHNS